MDAGNRVRDIFRNLDSTPDIHQNVENAMKKLGFDFKTESREVMDYIGSEMEKTIERIYEANDEIRAVLRECGVTDAMIAWGTVGKIKATPWQKRKAHKLAEKQKLLIDTYYGYYILETIILKNSDEEFTPHPLLRIEPPRNLLKEAWKK